MSTYTDNRDRYLAVPGGSYRPLPGPRCTCLARDVTDQDIEFYQLDECGWLWAYYYHCQAHGGRQVSAVAVPNYVARDDNATAGTVAHDEAL